MIRVFFVIRLFIWRFFLLGKLKVHKFTKNGPNLWFWAIDLHRSLRYQLILRTLQSQSLSRTNSVFKLYTFYYMCIISLLWYRLFFSMNNFKETECFKPFCHIPTCCSSSHYMFVFVLELVYLKIFQDAVYDLFVHPTIYPSVLSFPIPSVPLTLTKYKAWLWKTPVPGIDQMCLNNKW